MIKEAGASNFLESTVFRLHTCDNSVLDEKKAVQPMLTIFCGTHHAKFTEILQARILWIAADACTVPSKRCGPSITAKAAKWFSNLHRVYQRPVSQK